MSRIMSQQIGIRPGSDVYSTYKRMSYKTWYAIGEFVDNATQNYFTHADSIRSADGSDATLTLDIVYDPGADTLVVADDAHGMELDELTRAVQLNRPPSDTSGRSEFGMGLKMAACWLGKRWRIVTKQLGSDTEYEVVVDVDTLAKDSPDSLEVLARQGIDRSLHYTRIEIEGLYRTIRGRAVGRVKEHLSSIYRRDISSGSVTIKWNSEPLAWEPDPVYEEVLPDGERLEWKKRIDIEIEGLPVKGWVWIRLPGDARRAGLHLFRRGRLVRGGPGEGYKPEEIFAAPNSFQSQRLVGELNMDIWPVTQTKDDFDWIGDLEHQFVTRLREEVAEYAHKVQTIKSDRGRRPTKADVEIAGDVSRESFSGPEVDEAVIIVEEGPPPVEESEDEETERVTEASKEAGEPTYVTVGSKGLPTLKVYWLQDASASEIYADYASPNDGELVLNVNLNHPFVVEVLGRDPDKLALWTQILFVDALVEKGARRRGPEVAPSAFRKFKDVYLRSIGHS